MRGPPSADAIIKVRCPPALHEPNLWENDIVKNSKKKPLWQTCSPYAELLSALRCSCNPHSRQHREFCPCRSLLGEDTARDCRVDIDVDMDCIDNHSESGEHNQRIRHGKAPSPTSRHRQQGSRYSAPSHCHSWIWPSSRFPPAPSQRSPLSKKAIS